METTVPCELGVSKHYVFFRSHSGFGIFRFDGFCLSQLCLATITRVVTFHQSRVTFRSRLPLWSHFHHKVSGL